MGRKAEKSALRDWNGIGTSCKRMASWGHSGRHSDQHASRDRRPWVRAGVQPISEHFEASREFQQLIENSVQFDEIRIPSNAPRLLISAAEVRTGEFRIFRSHEIDEEPADEITSDVILASAAVPTLFRAVHLGQHLYWDGLFAQNPPVRIFRTLPGVKVRTDFP